MCPQKPSSLDFLHTNALKEGPYPSNRRNDAKRKSKKCLSACRLLSVLYGVLMMWMLVDVWVIPVLISIWVPLPWGLLELRLVDLCIRVGLVSRRSITMAKGKKYLQKNSQQETHCHNKRWLASKSYQDLVCYNPELFQYHLTDWSFWINWSIWRAFPSY